MVAGPVSAGTGTSVGAHGTPLRPDPRCGVRGRPGVLVILAHGVGGQAELPVEPWLLAYSAAFALLFTFAALRLLWPGPRLAAAADGRILPSPLGTAGSALGTVAQVGALVLFAVTMAAAWFGEEVASANLAPTALFVAFWVGVPVASAVVGDVWRRINPLWTVASGLDRLRGRDPGTSTATGWWATHWPAALGLLAFHWLELAYFEPASVTAVAVFLSGHVVVVLVAASRFGAGWVRTGDGFAVLFHLLAALAPVHRDDQGRLRLRSPVAGLATVVVRPGTLAVVVVVLGGTIFDGVTRTGWWGDVVGGRRGWDLTLVATIGLLLTIATVSVAHLLAVRALGVLAGDDGDLTEQGLRWVPSLIPVVLGYVIAHHFSSLVFEGQGFVALLSDPLGSGRDLFGTAGDTIDLTVVSADQVTWVQVAALVVGHVAALVAVHDRAVARYPLRRAVTSQYPMLAVLIASVVAAILLLVG